MISKIEIAPPRKFSSLRTGNINFSQSDQKSVINENRQIYLSYNGLDLCGRIPLTVSLILKKKFRTITSHFGLIFQNSILEGSRYLYNVFLSVCLSVCPVCGQRLKTMKCKNWSSFQCTSRSSIGTMTSRLICPLSESTEIRIDKKRNRMSQSYDFFFLYRQHLHENKKLKVYFEVLAFPYF